MKKFIALALVIVMMAAISLPVFAAELPAPLEHYGANRPLTDGANSGEVEVHYEVKSAYEVCIPENVVFADNYGYKFTADVEAKNVIIGKNQQLRVYLKSANDFRMMPIGEGNEDGVLYVVGYVKNQKPADFQWPETTLGDNSQMSTKLQAQLGADYKEAVATVDGSLGNEVVFVQGGSKQTVGTTMMFFLPQQETTLGHYVDILTFSVDITGQIVQG